MRRAVYNSAIPKSIPKSVNCKLRSAPVFHPARLILLLVVVGASLSVCAIDWSVPEQQLARKIIAVTGPGTVALTVEDRSSLGRRDNEIVQNGIRSALEQAGIHIVAAEQATATVAITLSENADSYVWVAQIRLGAAEPAVVMVSIPRTAGPVAARDSMPMSLRKALLWAQDNPILDVAVLEDNGTPTRIAVLDGGKVSIYRLQGSKWQLEQEFAITHAQPWPRDLRGRLIPAKDHLLDVYLPGLNCRSNAAVPLALNCRESDDPWPLVPAGMIGSPSGSTADKAQTVAPISAFFAPTRNFFTGTIIPAVGRFTTVSKFYSTALLPRDKYTLWLFTAVDGQVHLVDGMNDQSARFQWGSSISSLKTVCGAGWQVLATSAGERSSDFVRAYEFPDRDPVAVTAPLDLSGAITALWTESKGDSAIAVVRDQDSESYEAFLLSIVCGQ